MLRKKKLLHVISFCNGGASRVMEDIILNVSSDYDVSLLILTTTRRLSSEILNNDQVRVYELNCTMLFNPLIALKIRPYLKNMDIVHVHLFPTLYWTALAGLCLKNHPFLIFTEHASQNNRRKYSFLRPLEYIVYSMYDKIVGVSSCATENLIKWIGLKNKIVTINNGIDIKKIRENAIETNLHQLFPQKYLLTMVARLSKDKDFETIIRAMKELEDDYHLILVGDGEERMTIETMIHELELSRKITLLGYRQDISSLLKTSDLSILSSHAEGFSIVVLESLAVGTLCLGSDVDGIKDILPSQYLFQKGNVPELVQKIKTCVRFKESLEVKRELEQVCSEYEMNNMITGYKLLYG